jgi:glycosyltransferase involved in cell wall biosynthesis
MLSICIPVYNYDVSRLVRTLHEQLLASEVPFEILLIDDASLPGFRETNQQSLPSNTSYSQLDRNIGRSKIRNLLAQKAQYPYLLFMDCDSAIPSSAYISRYLPVCQPGGICYGGCIYEKEVTDDSFSLRWKYGRRRESRSAAQREKHPNTGFRTNNFLIDKDIFNTIMFNEEITEYGHEDTFFGLEMEENGITVQHIDNPLIHLGLEDNQTFLKKTESSLANLVRIEHFLKDKNIRSTNYFQIIRTKNILKKFHLQKITAFLFKIFRSALTQNLCGKNPNLLLFDFYRLGFFCNIG